MGYPNGVYSPGTLTDGVDYPQAAHVNDLRSEITAVETALLTGLPHPVTFSTGVTVSTGPVVLGQSLSVAGPSTFGGAVVLSTGALTLNQGQIVFPATQVASANANTLDDYEEGTFTPTVTGSGGGSGQTYASQFGAYTKIGRQVTVHIVISLTAKGTITTNLRIAGLPFAAAIAAIPGVIAWADLASSFAVMVAETATGQTYLNIYGRAATTDPHLPVTTADLNDTSGFNINLTYYV